MQLYIFEDKYYKNLEPITLSRPAYDLICGAKTLKEKIFSAFPNLDYSLLCRRYLSEIVKQENKNVPVNEFKEEPSIFVNGRVIAPPFLNEIISSDNEEEKLYINYDEEIVAAKVSSKKIKEIKKKL